MGLENDVLLSYLEDNARFADLFNCFYFGGEQIVKPRDLKEASEVYTLPPEGRGGKGRKADKGGKDGKVRKKGRSGQRIRDIKRHLKSGGCLKVLALEAQSDINYYMPWRIMEYDCMEYGRQIRQVQRRNREAEEAARDEAWKAEKAVWEEACEAEKAVWEEACETEGSAWKRFCEAEETAWERSCEAEEAVCERSWEVEEAVRREFSEAEEKLGKAGRKSVYANSGELLGRFRREDRLAPVYTLCLYTGSEEWDGPRTLRDMMDFGTESGDEETRKWQAWFADYPMRLVCTNEPVDGSSFRTALGTVFALLPLRKDKAGLRRLLEQEPAYRKMDEETARTVSLLMGVKVFMEKKEKYKEGEGYNMCLAIREMMEDSRMEGWEEGEKAGWEKGEKAGWEKGEKVGWEKGEKARMAQKAEGIRILIRSSRDDGIKENMIAEKLQAYYAMTETDAWAALRDDNI